MRIRTLLLPLVLLSVLLSLGGCNKASRSGEPNSGTGQMGHIEVKGAPQGPGDVPAPPPPPSEK